MPNDVLIVCLTHPFEIDPFLLIKDSEVVKLYRNVNVINNYEKIVSYDFTAVVDNCRENLVTDLPTVVDIKTAKKLIVGRPKSDFHQGKEPWTLKNILGNSVNQDTLRWLNDLFKLKTATPQDDPNINVIIKDIMVGFSKAWDKISQELIDKDENARFYDTEVPVYNLFIKSQIEGITVPQVNINKKLKELKYIYFKNIKKLELEYSFLSQRIRSHMNWDDISDYCSLPNIKEDLNYNFWEFAEIYSEYDEFLDCLVKARKSTIDYNALIRYYVDQYKNIYPRYEVMGTVTGRVLVSSPGIQYLKKTSRSIFDARKGYVLIYADFDQFEPGIIASFSKDPVLLEIYNSGDVYDNLSSLLFGNTDKRKIAKIIFLSFVYGMSQERLEKFIFDLAGDEAKQAGMKFFEKFTVLVDWKEKKCDEAKSIGYSSSFHGNRRYLESPGNMTNKEKRWVPNQIIQGTASLIFKNSLLDLNKRLDYLRFLVPMHDAILVETPEQKDDEARSVIEDVFNSQFQKICPDIKTSISFENFSLI